MQNKLICSIFLLFVIFFGFGCSGSKPPAESTSEEESEDILIEFEKSFDPGRYPLSYEDEPSAPMKNNLKNGNKKQAQKISSGFRVQTTISGELSECQKSKKLVQQLFPDKKAYIVHEFPFYKLRIGDFRTRKEAEEFIKLLNEKDIKTGLIVPDKIVID